MSDGKPIYGPGRFPALRGKKLCRGCGGPITEKYRRTWCSAACKERFDPPEVKWAVQRRDKYVCQGCGLDIAKAIEEWRAVFHSLPMLSPEWRQQSHRKPAVEYHHVVPFSEGGLTTPDNVRTLCHSCHVKVTAEWRRQKSTT